MELLAAMRFVSDGRTGLRDGQEAFDGEKGAKQSEYEA